jgi:hypothetical protein
MVKLDIITRTVEGDNTVLSHETSERDLEINYLYDKHGQKLFGYVIVDGVLSYHFYDKDRAMQYEDKDGEIVLYLTRNSI